MAKPVRIPRKVAAQVRGLLVRFDDSAMEEIDTRELVEAIEALDKALKEAKPGRAVKAARGRAKAKRQTRKERVAELRTMVAVRAGGHCESCGVEFGDTYRPEMDHFHGGADRRALESFEGCWLICQTCHGMKTRNVPHRGFWLRRFLGEFSGLHMYRSAPQRQAQAELEALELAASLPMGRRAEQ